MNNAGEIIMKEEPLILVSDEMFNDPEKMENYLDKLVNRMGSEKVAQVLHQTTLVLSGL